MHLPLGKGQYWQRKKRSSSEGLALAEIRAGPFRYLAIGQDALKSLTEASLGHKEVPRRQMIGSNGHQELSGRAAAAGASAMEIRFRPPPPLLAHNTNRVLGFVT